MSRGFAAFKSFFRKHASKIKNGLDRSGSVLDKNNPFDKIEKQDERTPDFVATNRWKKNIEKNRTNRNDDDDDDDDEDERDSND